MEHESEIVVRECVTMDEFDACVRLQREAFGLPDLEISPRRHLIVSRSAGGWVLGAFAENDELVGFVLHLVAARGREIIGYSHMMAVASAAQNKGIGARLKWAQRERALREGCEFIQWTWDPMRVRNAHFNLNRLGVTVRRYAENFYGTDYLTSPEAPGNIRGLDSDRLIAEWPLRSPRVKLLARGEQPEPLGAPATTIALPSDWSALLHEDGEAAPRELRRVRTEFQQALAGGLICAGFERKATPPRYLLYQSATLDRH